MNPKQLTQLRKDSNFLSADKYGAANLVMVTGEVGMIAKTHIVPTRRVTLDSTGAFYTCPLVKLTNDTETEDDTAALTIYLKRDTNVETERHTLSRTTDISADKFYTAALSDQNRVILAKFKKEIRWHIMADMTPLGQLRMLCQEDRVPYFTDEQLQFQLDIAQGDIRFAAYHCLIAKAENTTVQLSGMTIPDTSRYWLRLAAMVRPTASCIIKGG
ncbi:N4-gp56 family major capsid protein [Caproicibacterium lactatifermentans]|uniref:N4-gp56 family major capsid protein n=1 Tax=Caproicibacterium lactatifermentans TaxID=2666138 RepID=UPI002367F4B1|nr:N4-gp56 family major capsid protein [Caproicibacterium lactatifermentans]